MKRPSVFCCLDVQVTYLDAEGPQHNQWCPCFLVPAGFGGCDLHGDKSQIEDQQLKGCNKHMLVNWALGLPVRYFRRNDDDAADTKTSLIYDGLYYIVSGGGGCVVTNMKDAGQPALRAATPKLHWW